MAHSGVHYEISGKIKPIRDFYYYIFIVLGSGLVLDNLAALSGQALWLSFVCINRQPSYCYDSFGAFGYKPRTGYGRGLVAQVSEFSLILVRRLSARSFAKADVALMTLVAIVTISFHRI